MQVTSNVLNSPAVAVLCDLEHAGLDLAVVDGRLRVRPVERLTAEHEQLIRQHRDALVTLLRICDQGVRERVAVFRAQLEADPTTIGPFLFKVGVPYGRGACFSCGACLPDACFGRCWRCSLAWRLACQLPVPAELARAYDETKVVA